MSLEPLDPVVGELPQRGVLKCCVRPECVLSGVTSGSYLYRSVETLSSRDRLVSDRAVGRQWQARTPRWFCPPPTYEAKHELVGEEPTVFLFGEEFTFRKLTDKPLNERLGKIIPELKKAPRPTSEPWWPKLRQIQTLAALSRHGITDAVRRPPLHGIKSLAERMCDREYGRRRDDARGVRVHI